jgi:UDP-glucuronate 4-epimerase
MAPKICITGCAGFIGYHLALRYLNDGASVIGIDNLNPYYDINLKKDRLSNLSKASNFSFHKLDITNKAALKKIIVSNEPNSLIHLAAQAGVRFSVTNPEEYIYSNQLGFFSVLESIKGTKTKFLYASSSSVYGLNHKMPFAEIDPINNLNSIYAVTKHNNEELARIYAKQFQLNAIGMRFFTVYGPWGRPDMALYKFVKSLYEEKEITLFNSGKMIRDFTFIEDIISWIVLLEEKFSSLTHKNFHEIYNLGSSNPVELINFINEIEDLTGKKFKIHHTGMQTGDVPSTYADITKIKKATGYLPKYNISQGLKEFIQWYCNYEKIL